MSRRLALSIATTDAANLKAVAGAEAAARDAGFDDKTLADWNLPDAKVAHAPGAPPAPAPAANAPAPAAVSPPQLHNPQSTMRPRDRNSDGPRRSAVAGPRPPYVQPPRRLLRTAAGGTNG